MAIPMSEPDITSVERAAVQQVLGTTTLSIGPWTDRFEQALAARLGVRHAAAVSSGTAGLHLAMLAAGIEEDDLVITTPFSFVASVNCILYARARPVLVDVEPTALTIDPEAIERRVRELTRSGGGRHRRLKAILPVHVFGQTADMDPILDIARRHDLVVVEDACEAIGATYKGRPAGTLGDAAVFAFYPNKQVTTGEGGMVVTPRADWDALFRSLRNQGRDVFDGWLSHTRLGYNYRLDELSAALGTAQLARLDELLSRRAQVASWYGRRLERIDDVTPPAVAPWTTRMSWFVYVVRVPASERDRVIHELARRDIPARPYFPPIHLQPYHRRVLRARPGDFPVTEAAGETCLALPFFGTMREAQVDEVCGALDEALHGAVPRRASA
ncbi:MAG TPA: DegT/DnrJ/EryC1/StrS family aminotransferase [Candidatus Binatia bacterium]|jgi:dTDP-4-amino-4,6-dideoxygalactose transaminase|nr:DegT/DnrJ/EryC1/StrS family aminotransferase [Candidatus Binatia bacterium]